MENLKNLLQENNEEAFHYIEWKQVEGVLNICKRLSELPANYGEKYTYKIKADYRKNEYVFGVTLQCDLGGNLKIEDYVAVMFSDSDSNMIDESELTKMNEEIDSFISKVAKLKNTQ